MKRVLRAGPRCLSANVPSGSSTPASSCSPSLPPTPLHLFQALPPTLRDQAPPIERLLLSLRPRTRSYRATPARLLKAFGRHTLLAHSLRVRISPHTTHRRRRNLSSLTTSVTHSDRSLPPKAQLSTRAMFPPLANISRSVPPRSRGKLPPTWVQQRTAPGRRRISCHLIRGCRLRHCPRWATSR